MRASRTLLALAVLLGEWGCSYSFRNPVEQLGPGEVGGRAVTGAHVALEGVAISLKGAGFDPESGGTGFDARSRANGHFAVLPLPVGRHTLVFRKGQDRSVQRVVDVALGKDGQPQGVWLGDVEIPAAVALQGEVALPGGALLGDNGVVIDETSGATAAVQLAAGARSGTFLLAGLALGTHRFRFAASDAGGVAHVAGPVDVTFSRTDAGTLKRLARQTLRRPTTARAPVTMRLGVIGSVPGLRLSDLRVNGLGQPVTVGPDGSAQVRLAEGTWTVTVELPAWAENVAPPPPVSFVAVAGATIDLGTLYAVSGDAATRALYACHQDPDCAPSGTCSGGTCSGWTPPQTAPASLTYCDASFRGACTPGPVGTTQPVTRACVQVGAATAVVNCGTCCTPDGVEVACALPGGPEGCPPPPPVVYSYSISGRVSGAVASGVQVNVYGLDLYVTTDADGNYTVPNVPPGSYELHPWAAGYGFSPQYRMVTVTDADFTGQDFVASPGGGGTHQISGTISNTGGVGVLVTLSGYERHVTVTDAAGAYHFANLPESSYYVTPDLTSLSFSPVEQYVGLSSDAIGINFTATHTGSGGTACFTAGVTGERVCRENPLPAGGGVQGMWGASATDAWMVGFGPPLRWNGTSWTAAGGSGGMQAVRGSSATDVWAVGIGSSHWDGVSWTTVAVPLPVGHSLQDVWALGTTAWAVGDNGAAVRWDGVAWNPEPTGTSVQLNAVWGAAQDDVWAAGANGAMLHWDGSVWTSVNGGTESYLTGLWGSAWNDVWGTGPYGAMLHWDGVTWTTIATPTGMPMASVWGFGANDVWAAGHQGEIIHWDGTGAWTPSYSGMHHGDFFGLWGSAPDDVWAVSSGFGTEALLHWDGASWTNRASGTRSAFTAVWETPLGHVMVIRDESAAGVAAYQWFDGASWRGGIVGSRRINAVWGASETDAFAVGDFGTIARWNGSVWIPLAPPTTSDLFGVGGTSTNDVWAVGDLGTAVHWDGAVWTTVDTGSTSTILHGVWAAAPDDAWAVGADGIGPVVIHWDGATWSAPHAVPTSALSGVWGSASNDVWAVGQGSNVLRWDGAGWNALPIFGIAPTGIGRFAGTPRPWVVGDGGAIRIWDGSDWTELDSGTTEALSAVSGSYAVGAGGTILRVMLP